LSRGWLFPRSRKIVEGIERIYIIVAIRIEELIRRILEGEVVVVAFSWGRILRSTSLLLADDVHSFIEHLLPIVIKPFDVRLLSLSHLLLELELSLYLVEPSQLHLIPQLLPDARHLLVLLQLDLIEL
jgi:hypothetical protein